MQGKKQPAGQGGHTDADGTVENPLFKNTINFASNQHDSELAAILALEKWHQDEIVVAEAFRSVAGQISPDVDAALQIIESGSFLSFPGAVARLRMGYAHVVTNRRGSTVEDLRRFYSFAARVFRESGILREEGAA